jgi:hypothetical protein
MLILNDQEKLELEFILGLKTVTTSQASTLRCLVQKYVDPKCNICLSCPAQVRMAYNRLKAWFDHYKANEPSPEDKDYDKTSIREILKKANILLRGNPSLQTLVQIAKDNNIEI